MNPKRIRTIPNERTGESIETPIKNNKLKYMLIKAESGYVDSYDAYNKVEEEVNQKLKEGWNLYGGISVGNIGNEHFCICQAMVKEEYEYEEEF